LDILFEKPLIGTTDIANQLSISRQAVIQLADKFQNIGILREISGR